jgi:hypothetical protein
VQCRVGHGQAQPVPQQHADFVLHIHDRPVVYHNGLGEAASASLRMQMSIQDALVGGICRRNVSLTGQRSRCASHGLDCV